MPEISSLPQLKDDVLTYSLSKRDLKSCLLYTNWCTHGFFFSQCFVPSIIKL